MDVYKAGEKRLFLLNMGERVKGDPDATGLFYLRNEAGKRPVSLNHRPHRKERRKMTTIDPIRYPIGTFQPPAAFCGQEVEEWIKAIREHPGALREAVSGLNEEQLNTPYRDGGWTIAQVVHHLADASMNAFLRTKWGLTEEHPLVKPFAESEWAKTAEARSLAIEPSLVLLDGLHARWAALLEAMTEADFHRTVRPEGAAKEMPLYVLTALYAWHGKHHTAQILALRQRKGW
ncbi:hypothetical protein B4113_3576 [Geobacillus sp. B4113_201601]|nr:hypothetical protein B4113_3576 [Geobacillus sp. B4113_201601]